MKKAHNFIDLTGKKYGRLTVKSRAPNYTDKKRKTKACWNCQCDCGTLKIVRSGDLRSGRTKSCGCWNSEKTKAFNILTKTKVFYDTFSVVWQSYKRGARSRGLEFLLDKKEFLKLTQQNCYYCGIEPRQERKPRVKTKSNSFVYNGIDRLNSSLGYTTVNCVSCCKHCNYMKRDMSYDDFIEKVKRIASQVSFK